jgi:hypothetical protein
MAFLSRNYEYWYYRRRERLEMIILSDGSLSHMRPIVTFRDLVKGRLNSR